MKNFKFFIQIKKNSFITYGFLTTVCCLIICTSFSWNPIVAQTLIDFDDVNRPRFFANSTPLSTEYSSQGVTFSGSGFHNLDQAGGFNVSGYSPPNHVAWNNNLTSTTETLTFSPTANNVSFLAGSTYNNPLTAEAFNAGGTSLGAITVSLTNTMQLVSLPFSDITTVIINVSQSGILDDLTLGTCLEINCPSDITVDNDAGLCGAVVAYTVTASDICSGGSSTPTQTVGMGSGSLFPVGITANTFTITSGAHSTQCSFTVTVNDNENPIAMCPNTPPVVTLAANGSGTLAANALGVGNSTDNCSVTSETSPATNFTCADIGTQTVVLTASDGSNTDIENCNITVQSSGTLQAICPNTPPVINLDNNGNGILVDNALAGNSTGSCGSITESSPATNFTCTDIGTQIVTLTVTDNTGSSNASCNVTINDNTPPQITCPDNITVNNDPGLCTATVIYTTPVGTDNCTPTTMQMQGIASGNDFPVGFTTNTFEVSDGTQTANCSFTVTVNDNEVPEFTFCPSDITQNTDPNSCETVVNFAPTVVDNCAIGVQGMLETSYDSNNGQRGVMFDITAMNSLVIQKFDANLYTGTIANYEIYYKAGSFQGSENNAGAWTLVGGATGITSLGNNVPTPLPIPVNVTIPAGETYGFYVTNDFGGGTSYTDINSPTNLLATNSDLTVTGGVGKSYPFGLNFNFRAFNGTIHYGSGLGLSLTQIQGPPSGSSFTVGTSAVTFQAIDGAGNSSECSFDVTINDNENPVAICQNIDVQLEANGSTTLTAAQIDNGSSDNCSVSVAIPPTTFDCDNLGANNVILTATDPYNNTHTCISVVTVKDDNSVCCAAPVANCQAFTAFVNDSGNVTITEADVDNNSTADCGLQSLVIDNSMFDCSDIGTAQEVTLTITDINNDSDNCSAMVTVVDNILPEITCPSNIMVNNDLNQCAAIVNFTEPVGTDNCPSPMTNLTSTLGNGDLFPVGISTVSYQVTDGSNQTATCDFTVTVTDNQAPQIACPTNIMVNNDLDQCAAIVNFTEPVGIDNCPSPMTNLTSTLGNGDLFPVGISTVSYQVTDGSSQTATCDFTITVMDNQAPEISCPTNITVNNDPGLCTAIVMYTTHVGTDNCTPTTTQIQGISSGGDFPVGITTNTFEVTDGNLNGQCSFTVTVNDTEAPVITYCPEDIIQDTDNGNCDAVVAFDPITAIDNCALGAQGVLRTLYNEDNGQRGIMFDIEVTGTEEVFIRNMDANLYGGTSTYKIWYKQGTYQGSQNNSANWTLAGTATGVTSLGRNRPTPLPIDIDVTIQPGETYGFYVTNTSGGGLFYSDGGGAGVVFASNSHISVSGGLGKSYPFGLNFNPRKFNGTIHYGRIIDITQTQGFASGSAFPVGNTPMSFDVTDEAGNTANCDFTVTVNDNQAPVLSCPADITVDCGGSTDPADTGMASATDNCEVELPITYVDQQLPAEEGYIIERTWMVEDIYGNPSTCVQTIMIDVCEFEPADPCLCLNNSSVIDLDAGTGGNDGQFSELVAITGPDGGPIADATLIFEVIAITGGVDAFASAPVAPAQTPGTLIPLGTAMVYNPTTMHYELPFYHYEDIGYTISVQQIVAGVPGQILSIGNVCDYPNPVFDPALEDLYCPDATAITLGAMDLNGNGADAVSFTIDGMTTTTIDPANLSIGTHTVLMTFDGAAVTNDGSGTIADPNIPGCIQQVQKVIEVNDTEPPMITCPANITIGCDASTAPANTGMATATDNCNTAPTITFVDVSTQGQGCNAYSYTIIRTWTATDATNNFSTCSQVITVQDITPPMITCPANVTVECDQPTDPGATGIATANGDNCAMDSELIVTFSDLSTQVLAGCGNDNYTITRTWTATDPCGNTAQCDQIITVEDSTPATIICPANTTIECDEDTSPNNTGVAVAIDNCSAEDEISITFSDNSTQETTGCAQYMYTISRTWMATDACGNTSTCLQIINVEDTTPPAITCPTDLTIECDEDTSPANTGMATGMDNCSDVAEIVITSSDVSTQGLIGCAKYQYTITRTWTATDACGNSSTCVQTIEVDDTTPPVITCPANLDDLDCLSGPLPTANTIAEFIDLGGTGMDNCSTADEWMITFNDSPAGRDLLDYCSTNPADRTLTRTYSISDACGNVSTCAQTFTFNQSLTGPIITEIPLDQVVTCAVEAFSQMAAFNAETDCALGSTKTVEALPVIGTENCPGARYQFRYTVEDVCGRSASHIQTYTIQNDPFEYICPSIDCEIDCSATAEEAIAAFDLYTQHAIFVTSCAGLDPVVSYSFNPNSLGGCGSQTTVNFTATDPCGRSASCASTIVVVDNEAPVITGSISSTFRNCGSFAISDYQSWGQDAINSVDIDNNCDNTITWSYAPNVPNTENCGTGGISTTIVTFTATDNCGNASTTTAKFFLKDGPVSNLNVTVSGHLRTENDEMVDLVEVKVNGSDIEDGVETGDDGYYEFELPSENNYTVAPTRNDDPLNGISTMDLILISQHVLGVQSLDSPYKLIAADINNSGEVTALDMIALRKMILLVDDEFENNTSWRFIDADYVFGNPTNPFESTFPEDYSINDLTENTIADFIAVKTGDVNGSAIPNQLVLGDTREGLENLVFQITDQQLKSGESYTVDFKAKDFTEVLGYQFTLDFDTDQLELVDWTGGELKNLDTDNFGIRLHEGVLTSSWNVQNGLSLPDDAVLFSLTFKAKANVKLSQVISLSSRHTTAEAYSQSESLMNLNLEFSNDSSIDESTFALYQNQPNPFKSNTTIGFTLPESGEATLRIYDVSGRSLQVIQKDFAKGYNEVNINQSNLDNVGILYYRLETSNHSATKKMIIIK